MLVDTIKGERGQTLAIVLRNQYVQRNDHTPSVQFFTPDHLPLQVGKLTHDKGRVIPAHSHKPLNILPQPASSIMEVLVILKGALKVEFYDTLEVQNTIVTAGDTLILISGGHGFEALSDVDIMEVKQGPYVPDDKVYIDKTIPLKSLTPNTRLD